MQVIRLTLLFFSAMGVCAGQSAAPAQPQPPVEARQVWQMQESGTTAGLRGIDSVDGTVAWASGTGGTVLRTTDGGANWQKCAVPDVAKDGATLDFRGVQAWDAMTAIVMASGPGGKSRLYRTRDGCRSWKLTLKNRDKDGFWDALYLNRSQYGWLLGDPVKDRFTLFFSEDKGKSWTRQINKTLAGQSGIEGAFAASNSSIFGDYGFAIFGTGGAGGTFVYTMNEATICVDDCIPDDSELNGRNNKWNRHSVPLGNGSASAGVFSVKDRKFLANPYLVAQVFLIVGGDFTKPDESNRNAAWSSDGGLTWTASTTPPHGFRSAVQWSEVLKAWITVGTNGSDISRDDGKTWQPLDDGNWNALSLPFVVGPDGRIARLNPQSLVPASVLP
jgi:hypothetical protein